MARRGGFKESPETAGSLQANETNDIHASCQVYPEGKRGSFRLGETSLLSLAALKRYDPRFRQIRRRRFNFTPCSIPRYPVSRLCLLSAT